jgi:hypothetical protein
MKQERDLAIQKFIGSHESAFNDLVVGGVCKYPELVRQSEFRDYGFGAAIQDYKLLLFMSGVAPIDIKDTVNGVKDKIAKRNGKLDFIQFVHELKPTLLPQSSDGLDQGLNVMVEGTETILSHEGEN